MALRWLWAGLFFSLFLGCSPDLQELEFKGDQYLASGEFDSAIAQFSLLLDHDSLSNEKSAEIHGRLAFALTQVQRGPEAIDHLERAMVLDPKATSYPYNLASILSSQEEYGRALELTRIAVALDSLDLDNLRLLASLAVVNGQAAEAEKALIQAANVDSTKSDIWSNLGTLMSKQKRLAEAEHAFLRAVQCPDAGPEVFRNLGRLAMVKGDIAEANQFFRNAEEFAQNQPKTSKQVDTP